jgi:uncharacterized OB-fold protein
MTEPIQLEGYICRKCKWSDVFKVQTCPRCHGPTSHTIFQDEGQIASFTVVRYPPQGFEKESPYIVAIIDVKDGPRLMARVLASEESLKVGQAVRFAGSKNGALEFKA